MRKKQGTIRTLAAKAVEIVDMAGDLVGKAAKSGATFAATKLASGRSGKAKTKRSKTKRSSSRRQSAVRRVSAKAPKRRRQSR